MKELLLALREPGRNLRRFILTARPQDRRDFETWNQLDSHIDLHGGTGDAQAVRRQKKLLSGLAPRLIILSNPNNTLSWAPDNAGFYERSGV